MNKDYVEKMAEKITTETYRQEAIEIVNQIIADTTEAHLKAIKPFSNFQSMNYSAYVDAIDQAEVKGELNK